MKTSIQMASTNPCDAAKSTVSATACPKCPRANILGVGVSAIDMGEAIRTIEEWIATGKRHYVCVRDVHGVMRSQRDETLRHIHNRAGLVTPDGMPLVWLARAQGHRRVDRVYGPDLMLACCNVSMSKGYRHFFYGGAEGVPELLAERLCQRFPRLRIAGCWSPPFRELSPAEQDSMVNRINEAQPDIVWVGLGTPKQERWMYEYRAKLTAPVLIGVGAAFDFHAGLKKQAPRWMQRSGLEWSFRLLTEPRRLARRYLTNNPLFVIRVVLQAAGITRYELPGDTLVDVGQR
jgi:N-acetylglucosaminyldiphosphoundecaprenol N-acetyl-beta-D-mannosaminyltransferase